VSSRFPSPALLVVRYFSTEAPDLDAVSHLRIRLKSVHVQMVNPGDASLVAVSDYFHDSSDMPAQAVRKAFAGLRDKYLQRPFHRRKFIPLSRRLNRLRHRPEHLRHQTRIKPNRKSKH
jgi:hypothetical protein